MISRRNTTALAVSGRATTRAGDTPTGKLFAIGAGWTRPGQATAPVPPQRTLDVGARIRALRAQRRWTLEAAAQAFGIGRSTLRKVEAGRMSPTIGLLQKVAHGFGMDIAALLQPEPRPATTGRLTVTRAGQGELHETALHVHELLCAGLANKRMLPFRSTIKAHHGDQPPPFYRHDGEELIIVLDGQVTLWSEHYAPTRLDAGDAAYLDAHMGHCFIAEGGRDATVLFVVAE